VCVCVCVWGVRGWMDGFTDASAFMTTCVFLNFRYKSTTRYEVKCTQICEDRRMKYKSAKSDTHYHSRVKSYPKMAGCTGTCHPSPINYAHTIIAITRTFL
jgi:hypothetical protein